MSKIALGTVQFGIDYGINSKSGQVKVSEVVEILNYARNHNISLLDTALAYGSSEKVLGDAKTQDFDIVTKTRHFDGVVIGDKEAMQIYRDLVESIALLKRQSIYGLLLHNANDLLKPGADKIIYQLHSLKDQGLVNKIGVSVYTPDQLQKITDRFDIDLVQLPFSIIDRRFVDCGLLAKMHDLGIEVHARSVFLQGLMLMTRQNRPKKFDSWKGLWGLWDEWLTDNKLSALEATIRYAVSIPEISKVLVGVDSTDQLRDIVKSIDGNIPPIPKELYMHDADLLNPANWSKL
jgi:aryl-alcohol dehydrogenase-like predicted oxidoreductase